ncbi:MAG TPA: PhnD/SsuA/transferrin family substrate-binding protein [Gaiellales bacterium]|jgi:ABC-type phosphate/phosphonate transport system substrate-binding protein|nr:PhnD/SsuA/transferrin family substrate-binding protein [Gaiellales bacterium]
MPTLAVHSFLGHAARPHYEAVAAAVAERTGATIEALQETPLVQLPAVVAGPPALLFVCGLPYTRMRDAGALIEPLAAPVPEDEDGAFYRADLVRAPSAPQTAPEQLRGARVGFNGDDSLSGWVMPRLALRELGIDPDGYRWVQTGSHRNSLSALLRGEIDAAPIDSTVLALERRAEPALTALPIIARLGHMPSPPVALVGGDAGLAGLLRTALIGLCESDEGRVALALGAIQRFEAVADADYAPVRAADATR